MGKLTIYMFDSNEYANANLDIFGWIFGGILVGVGTRMGNGCTSGHGVCGLPRLAPRSFAATSTFMGLGFFIGTLRYYVPFLQESPNFGHTYEEVWGWIAFSIFILLLLYLIYIFYLAS
jgi:uncharacterized membrane protein YedE/YeeE